MSNRHPRAMLLVPLVIALVSLWAFSGTSPAFAAAGISLSRSIVAPNDSVNVTGQGFHAGDNVLVFATLNVSGSNRQVSTATQATGGGSFSATLTVPGGTRQETYTVTAQDFHGGQASKNLYVVPLAYFKVGGSIPTVYVIPLHHFYASGAGFKANETVKLQATFPQYNGNTVTLTRNVQVDGHGNFGETLLAVPRSIKAGKVDMTAKGQASGDTAKVRLDVFYRPVLTLTSTTVRPGTSIGIQGRDFVPFSKIHVFVTIPLNNGTTETRSRDASADGSGAFNTSIGLPGDVSVGKYSVGATDSVGGINASTAVTVSIHPALSLKPGSVYPGGSTLVSGSGFGSSVHITVSATFGLQSGGNKTVYVGAGSGGNGSFSARLSAPANANHGTVTVTAKSNNGSASTHLQVLQPKPVATATPTSTPLATATPTPLPTTSYHHRKHLGYRWVSIWYHTMTEGTVEHIEVQSTMTTTLGIWVHVYFPNSLHADYYENSDSHGFWQKSFLVPRGAIGAHSNQAIITFKFWHGKKSATHVSSFTIVK